MERQCGNVAAAGAFAQIPVYVVGVGTTAGGIIPQPTGPGATPVETIRSVLDRESLIRLAQGGGGEYFEIGRESDRDVAFGIIDRLRHLDERAQVMESFEELYLAIPLRRRHRALRGNDSPETTCRADVAGRGGRRRRAVARVRSVTRLAWRL